MLAGWLVARKGVVRSGDRERNWPGGGRGGSPLEGIASPGVGRTRLEESQRIGRQARVLEGTKTKNDTLPHLEISSFFGGVMSKIEFEQNWRYGYVLYYRKQVK